MCSCQKLKSFVVFCDWFYCINSVGEGEVWAVVELGAEGSLGSHRKFGFASGNHSQLRITGRLQGILWGNWNEFGTFFKIN